MLKKIIDFLFPPKKTEFDKFEFAISKIDWKYEELNTLFDQHKQLCEEGKKEESWDLFINVITPKMRDYMSGAEVMTKLLKI